MSLWAKSNQTHEDGSCKLESMQRVSFSSDPLNVLMRLEDQAVSDLHPEDLPDDRDNRHLSLSEREYVKHYVWRKL